jgi:hypothetical protein
LKVKSCKRCGNDFTPIRPLQGFCSNLCAVIKSNENKTLKYKEKIRKPKQKKESIQELIKAAQYYFNAWIKERDQGKACVTCGAKWSKEHQAGHFYPAGYFWAVRFFSTNCFIQCIECNINKSGNLEKYKEVIKTLITPDQLKELEAEKNKTANFSRDFLIDLKNYYKEKLKKSKIN